MSIIPHEKSLRDAGYGDYFPHRLGHGLGIGVHEYPSLTETKRFTIRKRDGLYD